jgi:hypothetical protein
VSTLSQPAWGGTINRLVRIALILAAIPLLAPELAAQRVVGTITRAATGAPVAGAIVSAFTDRGDTVPVTLSSSTGRFAIAIPAGRILTLYVRSIGLQAVREPVGPLTAGRDTAVDIRMESIVWTLAAVRVETVTLCDRKDAGTDRVAQLWVEVTNSLESSRQATRILKRQYDWRLFNSETNARTGERTESVREGSTLSERPFQAATVRELYDNGYVVRDYAGILFRAPDEAVLMHDRFLEAHCFWASTTTENGVPMMALHFTPVDALRMNDITGTFLIDATTFELKQLRFNYTRVLGSAAREYRKLLLARGDDLPPRVLLDELHSSIHPSLAIPGGEVHFRRLDDGTVTIGKFRLWVTDNWVQSDLSLQPLPRPAKIRETGGEILKIGGAGGRP